MTITRSSNAAALHNAVVALGDRHKDTLGMLPRQAFLDFLKKGSVFIAHEGDQVFGYLLFRRVGVRSTASIVHLCIDAAVRGKGLARQLIDALDGLCRATNLRAIELRCRPEYEAARVWPRLGFTSVVEQPGRSKAGTLLTRWRRPIGQPSLLSLLHEDEVGDRALVVVDLNILMDWEDGRDHPESHALRDDWLEDLISLHVAPESLNEIARHDDQARKATLRAAVRRYALPDIDAAQVNQTADEINDALGPPSRERDRSDRRQIAYADVAGAEFFVTRDEDLAALGPSLGAVVAVTIVTPLQLIEKMEDEDDPGRRLPSVVSGHVRVRAGVLDDLNPVATIGTREPAVVQGRSKAVRAAVAAHRVAWFQVAEVRGSVVAGVIVSPASEAGEVGVVACGRAGRLNEALLGELLLRGLGFATKLPTTRALVADAALSSDEAIVLFARFGFPATGDLRRKPILPPFVTPEDAQALIGPSDVPIGDAAWPSLVRDELRRTVVVPIRSGWAERLLGWQARPLLFVDELPFLFENCYYRSGRGSPPQPGTLILWYVSGGGPNTGIAAMSTVVSAQVGRKSDLYAANRAVGVFRWRDVDEYGEPAEKMTAIRFCRTLHLVRAVPVQRLESLYRAHDASWQNMITAHTIPWALTVAIVQEANRNADLKAGAVGTQAPLC